jgi:hypothetical protein
VSQINNYFDFILHGGSVMHQDCDEETQAGFPPEMVRPSSSQQMILVNDCTSLVTSPEVSDDMLELLLRKAEAGGLHSICKNGEVEVEVILNQHGSIEAHENIPVTREHHQHQEEQVISILDGNCRDGMKTRLDEELKNTIHVNNVSGGASAVQVYDAWCLDNLFLSLLDRTSYCFYVSYCWLFSTAFHYFMT